MAQRTVVFAEPAISNIEIVSTENTPVDITNLTLGDEYLLKVSFQNNSTNAIPPLTAYLQTGMGTGLELAPGFEEMKTVGILDENGFTKHYYRKVSQGQLSSQLVDFMPATYSGTITVKVKATQTGDSTASVNFLIKNANPEYILADTDSTHNSATVSYTIK